MNRTRTRAALALLPLATALALTACAKDGGDNGVASANGSKKGSPSASPSLSRDEQVLRYARCLRENGVDVADPKPGEGIQLSATTPAEKEKQDKALEACRAFAGAPPSEEDNAEEREDMLKYAACMRDNGVEAFKDPKPGEGINVGPEIVEDPDFKAAEKKCDVGMGDGKKVTNNG
ncbi:hypothetical protein AB0M28_33635 [Streptomyces sp. NPDC051940]|uniref:hypothetical protein n=1 Tax=Streptomyces sp. NPDC051940 TaxID=3155675 RepID=UPI0034424A3B